MALLADSEAQPNFTLLCLDVPQFREQSLQAGGDAANQLLRELAKVLSVQLPDAKGLGRLTSSSLVALIPLVDAKDEVVVAKRIKAQLQQSELASLFVPFTVGFSHYPATATNSRLLFREAQRPKYNLAWSHSALQAEPA